jgi:hypothetical protein
MIPGHLWARLHRRCAVSYSFDKAWYAALTRETRPPNFLPWIRTAPIERFTTRSYKWANAAVARCLAPGHELCALTDEEWHEGGPHEPRAVAEVLMRGSCCTCRAKVASYTDPVAYPLYVFAIKRAGGMEAVLAV